MVFLLDIDVRVAGHCFSAYVRSVTNLFGVWCRNSNDNDNDSGEKAATAIAYDYLCYPLNVW